MVAVRYPVIVRDRADPTSLIILEDYKEFIMDMEDRVPDLTRAAFEGWDAEFRPLQITDFLRALRDNPRSEPRLMATPHSDEPAVWMAIREYAECEGKPMPGPGEDPFAFIRRIQYGE